MADNPDIQWALKLLEPYEEPNPLYKYTAYFGTAIAGFCYGGFYNWVQRRPIQTGIQGHFMYAALFALCIGHPYKLYTDSKAKEKAAVARDYIMKHSEDFKQAPPTKFADVIEPWLPVR